MIGNNCCSSSIHFVLGLEPFYSSARAVRKEPSIRSSRKFQGWNSRVPAVELASSSGGIREFQQWNSTARPICRRRLLWAEVVVLLHLSPRFSRKSTAKSPLFKKSTAIYLIIVQCIAALCSRFSSFFHVFITRVIMKYAGCFSYGDMRA